jgi:hypothetical protein
MIRYLRLLINQNKLMRNTFCLILCLFGIDLYSQAPNNLNDISPVVIDSTAVEYARTITESDLKNYLSILASDVLEGRETGSRGQKMAAAFIREHFKDNKLKPLVKQNGDSLYFQEFPLYRVFNKEIYLKSQHTMLSQGQEVFYYGNASLQQPKRMELQFVGDGDEQDYRGLEVKEKVVAFFSRSFEDIRKKRKIALDHEAKAVVVINTDTRSEFQTFLDRQPSGSHSIAKEPHQHGDNILFFTNTESLANLLGKETKKITDSYNKKSAGRKNRYRKLNTDIEVKIEKVSERFETENVLGFIEGNKRKQELVVITAHYDHIGTDGEQIYNGADDDGSGTAAVMEMAQAFALAKQNGHGPDRSMLFMTVAGEENGLLGSEYYSDHPQWPLKQTVANLNIDMIGRVDPLHETSTDEYVYIIGSDRLSLDLHDINEQVNNIYTGLELNYKYDDENDPNRFYYRSDHYNFAKHNIPIIFYFNGTHADYHEPSDTIEKIRFDLLKKRTDLIFYCAWELVNRDERIRLNE